MEMKTNTYNVFKFLQTNNGVDFTAADIAQALDLATTSVNGIFTGAISNKGLGSRVESTVALEDGTSKTVKYLKLTPAGLSLDLAAVTVIG